MVCHSRAANYVLGLTELQMNKEHSYGAVTDNQLRTLEHIDVLRVNWLDHTQELRSRWQRSKSLFEGLFQGYPQEARQQLPETTAFLDGVMDEVGQFLSKSLAPGREQWSGPLALLENKLRATPTYATVLPRRSEFYQRLVDPHDPRADVNARARSYLHANCSQCHVMAGGGNSRIELEFVTPRNEMYLFGIQPQHHTYGIADAKLVEPGNPDRSVLLQRLVRRGPGQMPPLATSEVDREAVQLLREWIMQMKP
jgi:mono/diheme cytochrome c family protein